MKRDDYIYLFCGFWWLLILAIDQFYAPMDFVKFNINMGVPGIVLSGKYFVFKQD